MSDIHHAPARSTDHRHPAVRARRSVFAPAVLGAMFACLLAPAGAGAAEVLRVAAGSRHTCAVVSGGGVKCWGNNDAGQLGDGTGASTPAAVDVSGLTSGVLIVASGELHSCAVTSGGAVQCWGSNAYGQLGDGTAQPNQLAPVPVSGLVSGIASVASGAFHTCALTSSGGVACWGWNQYGQLGDGTTTDRNAPVAVTGLASGVAAVTAGFGHTCALMTTGGVKCWGYNNKGQLGDDTTTSRPTPVNVNALTSGVDSVEAGASHTCAVTIAGGAKCWGSNDSGQLGDGTITSHTTPVDVSGLTSGVDSVVPGGSHTCAVTTAGEAKCWGLNYYGQLGDGTKTDRRTPVTVSGLTSGVARGSAATYHSCVVMNIGGARCWGNNYYGEVGDGTTTQRLTPVWVAGLGDVREIMLSGDLAFGLVQVGTTAQRTLTIRSTGTATVTVSSISYPAGFSGDWSGTIAAGASQPVTVSFEPTAEATYGGTVTVNGNHNSGIDTIAASGTGYVPQPPAITSPSVVLFLVQRPESFTVTATGIPVPALAYTGALPSGVTFVDHGNGTATLGGFPAAGTAGIYPLTITATNGVGTPAAQSFTLLVKARAVSDFDGDGMSDRGVFRPSTGTWYVHGVGIWALGATGDVPVVADYDGNGTVDAAMYRPTTQLWTIKDVVLSAPAVPDICGSGSEPCDQADAVAGQVTFGARGDVPAPADFNGDGVSEIAVFRPSTGEWLIRGGATIVFGTRDDIPVPADYDGDGAADLAVFRPSTGTWYVRGQGSWTFGVATDAPVPADYDGDGAADIAVYRPSSGTWYVQGQGSWTFGVATDLPLPLDVDGDGASELVVYRPSTGVWYSLDLQNGAQTTVGWGTAGDVPVTKRPEIPPLGSVPGDWDGDGQADAAVFRPGTGMWYLRVGGSPSWAWGTSTDVPVPADYDGDGKRDIAVFRPATGTWHVRYSATNYASSGSWQYGASNDVPVPGDWDGDGQADAAVFRPSTGAWFLRIGGGSQTWTWGAAGDVPVAADYDGDGKLDLAVYRPSTGTWYARYSATNYATTGSWQYGGSADVPLPGDWDGDGMADLAVFRPATATWFLRVGGGSQSWTWGASTDVPVPADYDGDGKLDLAVFRPGTGTWYVRLSATGYMTTTSWTWGTSGDVPVIR